MNGLKLVLLVVSCAAFAEPLPLPHGNEQTQAFIAEQRKGIFQSGFIGYGELSKKVYPAMDRLLELYQTTKDPDVAMEVVQAVGAVLGHANWYLRNGTRVVGKNTRLKKPGTVLPYVDWYSFRAFFSLAQWALERIGDELRPAKWL